MTGPHGAGVETLLSSVPELRSWSVGSLEDLAFRFRIIRDPGGLLASGRWILHAVHLWPELWTHVREAVDRRERAPGQLVLTSPLQLQADLGRAERLGSRAVFLQLGPLTRRERAGQGTPGPWSELFKTRDEKWGSVVEWGTGGRADWEAEVRVSGLTDGFSPSTDGLSRLRSGRTLIEELSAITEVEAPEKLLSLLVAASRHTGNLLNRAALARAAGIPRPTAHRHLDLLERAYALRFLPAYGIKDEKRGLRTARLHVVEPALAIQLAGADSPEKGHLEALIMNELATWRNTDAWPPQLYHWGTQGGAEVPFVLERNGRFLPVGVTLSERPLRGDARALASFLDRMGPNARGALLLHTGEETARLTPRVWAVPWWRMA